jgi:hypothetical protein
MNVYEAQSIISILTESPLNLHLSLEERSWLLSLLINHNPQLLNSRDDERDEEVEVPKSNGSGIFSDTLQGKEGLPWV